MNADKTVIILTIHLILIELSHLQICICFKFTSGLNLIWLDLHRRENRPGAEESQSVSSMEAQRLWILTANIMNTNR